MSTNPETTASIKRGLKALQHMPFTPHTYTSVDAVREVVAAALDVEDMARVLDEHWHDYDADCYGVENNCGLCGEVESIATHQAAVLRTAILGGES